MSKLEDIPKKSVFKVPEDYFENLPTRIQSRMNETQRSSVSTVGILKYALPILALIVVGFLWFRPQSQLEDQFEDINSEQISLYLENTEHADMEELQDPNDLTTTELNQLEQDVYSNMDYSDAELLDELDLENL